MGGSGPTAVGRRVGELARAAGVTVRTLHHYDGIGLLSPSARTGSGHRLYAEADVARLYRICLLRRLGLPLRDIGRTLDDPSWSLPSALTAHLAVVDRRLEATGRLRSQLARLVASTGASAPTDELLGVLETMNMLETSAHRRISILVYADLESAFSYLVRVFALGPGHLARDDTGTVVHGELVVGDGVVWLHRETEAFALSSPQSLGATTASVAIVVEDVDAHCRHAVDHGARVEYGPVDQPYGYREYSARDNEGHLWTFMTPLE